MTGHPPLEDIEKLEIRPDLVKAYILNMGKAVLLVAALAGAVYLVQYLAGTDPFADIFSTLGIPVVWAGRAVIAIIAVFFILTFFGTLSLTSYSLVFEGDKLKYSYGSFFKVTRSTPISSVVRVNFREYGPLSLGDLYLELSGTQDSTLKVQYVSDVGYHAGLIHKLIGLKMSENGQT